MFLCVLSSSKATFLDFTYESRSPRVGLGGMKILSSNNAEPLIAVGFGCVNEGKSDTSFEMKGLGIVGVSDLNGELACGESWMGSRPNKGEFVEENAVDAGENGGRKGLLDDSREGVASGLSAASLLGKGNEE